MITKLDKFGRPIYEPGDIVAVANYNFLGRASRFFFEPQTLFYHYALIGDYLEYMDDYVLIESVNKGPTMGRLSWYRKKNYRVLRVNPDCLKFAEALNGWRSIYSQPIGDAVFNRASKFGRHGYDFMLFLKLFAGIVRFEIGRLLRFKGFRRLTPADVPYARDKALVCTELVFEAWRLVNINLCASGHAPIPAEFCLAEWRDELVPIDSHNGRLDEIWRQYKRYTLIDRPTFASVAEATEATRKAAAGVDEIRRIGEATAVRTGERLAAQHIEVDRPAPDTPGPDIIARLGGQKRNRVHVYRQPFGYPIQLCSWEMPEQELENTFTCATEEETKATLSTLIEAGEVTVCKNCQAIIEGKKSPPFCSTNSNPKGAGGGGVG